jgi:tetratricopeptide (TPR) repeat protein
VAFLARHPRSAVAHYLHGDAQARSGAFETAIESLTLALKFDERFGLAMNARGVVYAIVGNLDHALIDFFRARSLSSKLADAHANFGALAVLREYSLAQGDEALKAFDEAIRLNPKFALAYNGRGSLLFGSGRFDDAATQFQTARALAPFMLATKLNESFAHTYADVTVTLANTESKPGVTMQSVIRQRQQDTSTSPTQLLNAISEHRNVSIQAARSLADGVFLDSIHQIAEKPPNQREPALIAAVQTWGHRAVVLSLANNLEHLELMQLSEAQLSRIKATNASIPKLSNKYSLTHKSEVWTSFSLTMLSVASSAVKRGWVGVAREGTKAVARMVIVDRLKEKDHPRASKFAELVPLPGDLVAFNAVNVFKAYQTWNADRKLNGAIASLPPEDFGVQQVRREIQIDGFRDAIWKTNEIQIRGPVGKNSTTTPSGLLSGSNTTLRDVRYALSSTTRKSRVGIVSSDTLGSPSFYDRLFQVQLNRLGHVAPILTSKTSLPKLARQLQVANLVTPPQFAVLRAPSFGLPRIDAPVRPDDTVALHRRRLVGDVSRPHQLFVPPLDPPGGGAIQWKPIASKGGPGGVITKANVFVDSGNWPVLTGFGLAYPSGK